MAVSDKAYGQPKHRRSESKNGLKETFLDKPTSKKGPATRWLVIALLSVFFIGLVYMAAEYNHTRNKAGGGTKRKRRMRYAKPIKFGEVGSNLETSAAGVYGTEMMKPPKLGLGLPHVKWKPTIQQIQQSQLNADRKAQLKDVPERNEAETATKEWREQGDGTEDIEAQRASLKYDSAPEDEDEGADEAAAEEGEEEEDEQAEEEAEEQAEAEEQEEPHEGPKEEVNMGGATSAVLRRRQGRDASVSRGKAKKTSSPEIGFMWGKRPEGKQQQRRADAVDWSPRQLRRLAGDKKPVPRMDQNSTAIRKAAKALDFELMKGAPRLGRDFDPEFKNPCWTDTAQRTRCLPAFYIMGSFQAGAWTLYSSLAAHPQVLTTGINARSHFWGEHDKRMEHYVDGYSSPGTLQALRADPSALMGDASASTLAFYWAAGQRLHSAFRAAMGPCWQNCSSTAASSGSSLGECTDTVCFPKAQEADREAIKAAGIGYAKAQLPMLMRAVYGNAKPRLVAVLRNPVDRFHHAFWSHPHYRGKYGETAEGFLKYAKESVEEFEACEDSYGPVRCVLYFEALGQRQEDVFFHCDQLLRGIYTVYLESWIGYFGREPLLIVHAESYYTDPLPELRKASSHIGLPEADEKVLHDMAAAGERARTHDSKVAGAPDMLPEARRILEDFYAPWNHRLSSLLRDRRFKWAAPA